MYWLYVLRQLVIANLKTQLEYRLNFIIVILSAVSLNLLSLLFLWVILLRFNGLQHWSLHEVFFMFSLRLVAHGLYVLCFYNIQRLSFYVRQGEFNYFLLRPLNPLFQIVIWHYNPASIGDLGTGIICLFIANSLLRINWTPLSLGFLLLTIAGGCLIEAALFLSIHTLAFWVTDAERFSYIIMIFNDYFTLYPLTIYNIFIQSLLTFIVPVALISYYPAALFLNRTNEVPFTPVFSYVTPFVGIGLFTLAYLFWLVGLKHYQGTGS